MKEYLAWQIVDKKIVGAVFVTIVAEDNAYLLGRYRDEYGLKEVKFSKRTGKQFRPNWWSYLWLSKKEIIRQQ